MEPELLLFGSSSISVSSTYLEMELVLFQFIIIGTSYGTWNFYFRYTTPLFDTLPDCPERLSDVPCEHGDDRRLGFEGDFSKTHPALPEDLVVVVRELRLVDSPGCYAQEVPLSQVFDATLHRPRSDPEKLQDGSQARDFEHEVIGH